MARRVELSAAAAVLRESKTCLRGYAWYKRVGGATRNIMILSDPLEELAFDPLDNPERLHRRKFFNCYRANERYFVRTHAPRLSKLLRFLGEAMESFGSRSIILLPDNEAVHGFCPDPWIWKHDLHGLQRSRAVRGLFEDLGIGVGDRCAIKCRLPEDISSITQLASWYWHLHGRNLYIVCGRRWRLVVCHERDLHVCSLDHDIVRFVCRAAKEAGLELAPFDTQHCQ
jgi:hypothetical protein